MKINRLISLISIILIISQSETFTQIINLDTTISINPRQTYLRINNDPGTLNSVPLDLDSLGISWGDSLNLQQLGDYDNGPGGDEHTGMIGLFSANDSLLDPSQQHRVPGAIDAGNDWVSSPTWSGNLPTDIPEDFLIDTTTFIKVPDSAQYLFICAHDSKYGDNSDPDNDFGVRINIINTSTGIFNDGQSSLIYHFQLSQNYPNPFNPSTKIKFILPKSEKVKIEVFNLLGQKITTLLDNQKPSGSHEVEFNGQNLSSGIYYYKIEAGKYQQVRKMILLK